MPAYRTFAIGESKFHDGEGNEEPNTEGKREEEKCEGRREEEEEEGEEEKRRRRRRGEEEKHGHKRHHRGDKMLHIGTREDTRDFRAFGS